LSVFLKLVQSWLGSTSRICRMRLIRFGDAGKFATVPL
jgi:hypothetical protein